MAARKQSAPKKQTAQGARSKRASKRSNSDSKPKSPETHKCIVVGIGASAGGLEALKKVIPGLPSNADMAFVIVQHLDPKHRSMLASLLDRHTQMEVMEIGNGQTVAPNKIFITPAGKDLKIVDSTFYLSKPSSDIGPKPSIDYFFTTLAEAMAERAVGIILSGTGSDGAHGIRAIKAGGGITIVQREDTAKYNGMPHAAIETGHVDLIVAPEEIGKEIQVAVKYPNLIPSGPHPDEAPQDIDRILQMITARIGVRFNEYKIATINRRVGRRMALHKVTSLRDYVAYIEHFPQELDHLFKDILISVTSFFRDIEAFQALNRVITQLLKSKQPGDDIRIWIPGCSTGEEAYSIAMLISEHLETEYPKYNIQIFATDLDQDAIIRARRAVYPAATVADIGEDRLKKHFLHEDNTVQVKKSIREMIVFAKQDLTRDPPFSHLDLISCRNLLIYFNADLQKRIVPMFHYVLNPDGVLFLGKSESIGQFADLFEPVVKKWKIYKRRDVMKPPVISIGPPRHQQPGMRSTAGESRREKEAAAKHIMADSILTSFGHSAVLIDDRLEIVYVHGEVEPYLKLAQGQAGLNILNMVRPPLRLDLRSMIHKATRETSLVRSNPIKFEHNGNPRQVVLQAGPATVLPGAPALTLVIFEESAAATADEAPAEGKQSEDPRLMELEQELAATREHLQTTVEELETANEELQSLNEELQSANEELQSSNEELETSNEELQSTNEELTTVNEELQVKTNELAAANTDLENILKRTGIAMVIVNRRLKVTRFTPGVTAFFQMTAADRGQVLTTIPTRLTLPDLRSVLADVIEKVQPDEFAFDLDTHNYLMRVLPYLGETGQASGAMLIFLDRTEIMKTESALEKSTACQKVILEGVQDGIVIVSEDGVIETFNPAAERIWGYFAGEVVGRKVRALQFKTDEDGRGRNPADVFARHKAGAVDRKSPLSVLRKDGKEQKVAVSISEIWLGEKRKMVGIIREQSA